MVPFTATNERSVALTRYAEDSRTH